ncbi:28S ribosomal protein S31, mitochondrial-like isoform X1 [Vespa velutina]|uniref:28S ribosomal protein S31, mitochondrial-like isoform X1 n=2 Tax=Vespa velutina TaxID=202808 RepID=UPI001FB2DA9C|nr:28S ribosomal protein S31, mitochondrial-like isoform X1 [Vespa velutina]
MLATSVISIGIKFRIPVPTQRLNTLIKMYSASSGSPSDSSSSSGSSSDSSSDSDSDTEKVKKKKSVADVSTKSLDSLIDNLMLKDKKRIDVAMPVRKIIEEDKSFIKKTNKSYEARLIEAAKDVTKALNIDKGETKTQLLDRLSTIYKDNYKKKKHGTSSKVVNKIVSEHKLSSENKQIDSNEQWRYKADIVRKFKTHDKPKEQVHIIEPSIIKQLKKEAKNKYWKETIAKQKMLNVTFNEKAKAIFKEMKKPMTNIPKLSMWESLEKRELDLIVHQPPKNIFQEMIQWTESGILWKFPIDNEIGMEEESNVHFSEHVFLERHLTDWCPKSGPIRHFMELVCVGLSKNPYLTVDEKLGHITWYKEYFKGKKELLTELGAINISSTMKEQTKT